MKRVMCLCLIAALIVPVLLISGSAAETYVFELLENPPALLDSFDFVGSDGSIMLVYPGLLPDGLYSVSFYIDGFGCVGESVTPLDVLFGPVADGNVSADNGYLGTLNVRLLDGSGFVASLSILLAYFKDDATCLFLNSDDEMVAGDNVTVVFDSVEPAHSLIDYLVDVPWSNTLAYVVGTLSIVLPVLVGFIGFRKGFAWVRRVMRSA